MPHHALPDIVSCTGHVYGGPVVEDVTDSASTEYESHICLRPFHCGAEAEGNMMEEKV